MSTTVVRLDTEVVNEVKKLCQPTRASVGLYISNAAKAKLAKDKVRNADKIGGKKK